MAGDRDASASAGSAGWAPYLAPYLLFLALVQAEDWSAGAWEDAFFVLKSTLPLLLVIAFAARGAYPELRVRGGGPLAAAADCGVGVASAVLWVAPYLVVASLRPEEAGGFRPEALGAGREALALALRTLGYVVATPFVEELFVRSWLLRVVDVWDTRGDFRDVPVARFAWRSFLATTAWFTLSHAPWEWPVAVAWIVLTHLWFYRRGSLAAVVRVHAAANGSILLFVALCDGRLPAALGGPLSLWFFV